MKATPEGVAVFNVGALEQERRALRHIKARNQGYLSPLESTSGNNSFIDCIRSFQDSPLCWVGALGVDDEFRVDRVLVYLSDLYERAMQPWEQFRTVHHPHESNFNELSGVLEVAESAVIYHRWPYGTFPVETQREARLRYRELKTTSRFSMDEAPKKWALEHVNPPCAPLEFRHLAGLASTVCIAEALEHYEEILNEWAYAAKKQISRLPFAWLVKNEPGRLELFLSEYIEKNKGSARAREIQAFMLVKNAEAWLSLADSEDSHRADIEQVSISLTAKAKTDKANKNRTAAKQPRKDGTRACTKEVVASYFLANPNEPQKKLIANLSETYQIGKRTVSERLKEAKTANLMQ